MEEGGLSWEVFQVEGTASAKARGRWLLEEQQGRWGRVGDGGAAGGEVGDQIEGLWATVRKRPSLSVSREIVAGPGFSLAFSKAGAAG